MTTCDVAIAVLWRYQMRDTNSLYDSNIRKLSVTL